jgi:hypothetical protein
MDRTPSPPPAPRVSTVAQPSTNYVFADTEKFMEMIRRFTSQTAPTNAADRGAIVPASALVPVQQHQPMLATAAVRGPRVSDLASLLTLWVPSSLDNPGPCILNMAPDPRLLATPSSLSESTLAEEEEMEVDADEVEMEDTEEERAIQEGRFYLLPSPPPERNAGADEPELLNLFPLAPSSSEGN